MGTSFEDLQVWKKSVAFAVKVYEAATKYPDDERFGLKSQLCRASISVSSNIAEGHGRKSKPDFIRFLRIAMGSCRECQSLILVSIELGMFTESEQHLYESASEIVRMLGGLIKNLESSEP